MVNGFLKQRCAAALLTALVYLPLAPAAEMEAEIMHYWISTGEQAALDVIRQRFQQAGGRWLETPSADAPSLRADLIARFADDLPPTLAHWHGNHSARELDELGFTADLSAQTSRWRERLPAVVYDYISYQDRIKLVPMNIHGENWIWLSSDIFRTLNLDYPEDWQTFLEQAPRIRAAGYTPLAIGAQSWQLRMLFNGILLDLGGADAYMALARRGAAGIVDDADFLRALRMFAALRQFGPERSDLSWSQATRLVIDDRAALQVMGDWAKGEFLAAGERPGVDFDCRLTPNSGGYFVVMIDAFVFPKSDDPLQQTAQRFLVNTMMEPEIQRRFSLAKGSLPVRSDIPLDGFDDCALIGIRALSEQQRLLPASSIAAVTDYSVNINARLVDLWTDPTLTAERTRQLLTADVAALR